MELLPGALLVDALPGMFSPTIFIIYALYTPKFCNMVTTPEKLEYSGVVLRYTGLLQRGFFRYIFCNTAAATHQKAD